MDLMMLPEFIKLALFMAAVFISNIVQALTGFAGVMISIPPTILLYGPDMAKAVINAICWLVCAYLMFRNRKYINGRELFRIVAFMLVGMAIGIHLYNAVNQQILVPLYGAIIVGVALKNMIFKQGTSPPACMDCYPRASGRRNYPWHVRFRRGPAGGVPCGYFPG